jgi:hypothetical protein
MALTFAGAAIARRQLTSGVIDQVMNLSRAEDEVAWKNPLTCLQQGATRSGQFLFKLMFQLRTRLSGGGSDPRILLKWVRNFLLGNFIVTNGGAPGCELFRAQTAIASTDKFESSDF